MQLRPLFYALLMFALQSCQPAPEPPVAATGTASFDDTEYELYSIKGTATQRAERHDEAGGLVATGYVLDGKMHGNWTTYDPIKKLPKSSSSYVEGILDGPYFEFDDLGRFSLIAHYKNNELNGHYGVYKIGRPEMVATYVDGQLDGILVEYDYRNGKPKKEVTYKMGKKHGPLRYFNPQGEITVQYLYEEDEKVSGGIVEGGAEGQ